MPHVVREFNSDHARGLTTREYGYLLFLSVSLLLLFNSSSRGQWRKVNVSSTPSYPFYPNTISFNKWGIGFLAIKSKNGEGTPFVWRSLDGGFTWNQVTVAATIYTTDSPLPFDFTFKDSLTGWFAGTTGVYKTTDGGSTWFHVFDEQDMIAWSIFYNPSDKLLMMGVWGVFGNGLIISSDEGTTWSIAIGTNFEDYFNGFAFVSDSIGIIGPRLLLGNQIGFILRTSDGGASWSPVGPPMESWQPLSIEGTNLFYAVEDFGPNIFRSSDEGLTWTDIFDFDTAIKHDRLQGCIRSNNNGHLFVQTTIEWVNQGGSIVPIVGEGIFMSSDSGNSWTSICGPSNFVDTRFSIIDNNIIAGDYLTGNVWMLDLNEPFGIQLDSIFTIAANNCHELDTAFHLSSTYPCFGSVALDSVSLTGSPAFTAQSQVYQKSGIYGSDSIAVHYQSENPYDTAQLIFHFVENGIKHDTAITIYGVGSAPVVTSIYLKPSTLTVHAGDTIEIPIYMSGNTTLSGTTSVNVPVILNTQSISPIEFIPSAGFSLSSPIAYSNGAEAVQLQGQNITLNGETLIGNLRCVLYLSDNMQTSISLVGPTLTSDDPRCFSYTASIDTIEILFTGCGDSILLEAMQGQLPFALIGIQPNPASSTIEINLSKTSPVAYSLLDALGHSVLSGVDIPSTLNVSTLASGVYYLRLSQNGYVQTRKVTVKR